MTHCHESEVYKCSGFTLVVNLFNKDDAEDGGLSFFYSAETQSTNYLDTRLSPSLRLSLAERERISDPVSGKLDSKMAIYSKE